MKTTCTLALFTKNQICFCKKWARFKRKLTHMTKRSTASCKKKVMKRCRWIKLMKMTSMLENWSFLSKYNFKLISLGSSKRMSKLSWTWPITDWCKLLPSKRLWWWVQRSLTRTFKQSHNNNCKQFHRTWTFLTNLWTCCLKRKEPNFSRPVKTQGKKVFTCKACLQLAWAPRRAAWYQPLIFIIRALKNRKSQN